MTCKFAADCAEDNSQLLHTEYVGSQEDNTLWDSLSEQGNRCMVGRYTGAGKEPDEVVTGCLGSLLLAD